MTEQELSNGTLKAFEALEYLRETINVLTKEIVILKDERDEYRRKWLESINNIKDINNDNTLPTPD